MLEAGGFPWVGIEQDCHLTLILVGMPYQRGREVVSLFDFSVRTRLLVKSISLVLEAGS